VLLSIQNNCIGDREEAFPLIQFIFYAYGRADVDRSPDHLLGGLDCHIYRLFSNNLGEDLSFFVFKSDHCLEDPFCGFFFQGRHEITQA